MTISFSRYVDITSGVGGNNAVRQRDLITRIFTTNDLVPTGGYVEFTSLLEVGDWFGTSSEEYDRAQFYFGWISKNITKAEKISYGRWVDSDTPPQIFGSKGAQSLGSWTSITAGTFILTMGENTDGDPQTETIGPLNFSSASSLANVASIIQTEIRTFSGTLWTSATVTWNSARQSFDLQGGVAGAAEISVEAGSGGSDIAGQLGWLSVDTIISNGADEQTPVSAVSESAAVSNNFGSFLFMDTLTTDEITEVSEWNDVQNVKFMYLVPVTSSNASTIATAIDEISGTTLTLAPTSGQYDEMIPGIVLAATNYAARDSVQNYMFQIFPGISAKVTTDSLATSYDNIRVNYYGNTQTAGQVLNFYQRGVMSGASQDPLDQNVYANEMWLKDASGAAIMGLLLSLGRVSANRTGEAQILSILQGPINLALFNGTISTGKPLNDTQKVYITQITGDNTAWQTVQNSGYWKGCTIESYVTTDGRTEWKAVYTLVYSKDDAIRKVEGSHILI